MAACVVFVLIGAPIALRFPRGGVGLVIGVSLVVFAIYYIGLIAGESLADRAFLTPFWAMWAANVILTIVGLVTVDAQGGTSRFSFTNVKENVGVADKEFAFTVPRGVDVVRASTRD